MRRLHLFSWAAVLAVGVSAANGITIQVGPTRTYTTVQEGINAANASGQSTAEIQIDAATYTGAAAIAVISTQQPNLKNITFRGVNGRPVLDFNIFDTTNGRYGWAFGDNLETLVIDNIEFKNCRMAPGNSHMGSTITSDATVSNTISNCKVHNTDEAIFIVYGDGVVDHCEIYDTVISIQGDDYRLDHTLTVQHCYLHDAAVADIETHAPYAYILYNRIERGTSAGPAIYIDRFATEAYVIGNVIKNGDMSAPPSGPQDKGVIWNSCNYLYPTDTRRLYVVNNTIANYDHRFACIRDEDVVGGVRKTSIYAYNNIFRVIDDNAVRYPLNSSNFTMSHNWETKTPTSAGFANESTLDYHLSNASNPLAYAIDKGTDPGSYQGFSLTPEYEYVEGDASQLRNLHGSPLDIGAFEYTSTLTVDAGSDQNVAEYAPVSLHAAGTDSDGNTLTYSWTQESGATVTLTGQNTADLSFTAPAVTTRQEATLQFDVTATSIGGSATDSVTVRVYILGDVNHSDSVNTVDLLYLSDAWLSVLGDPNYNPACDFDSNGVIDGDDLAVLSANWGRTLQ